MDHNAGIPLASSALRTETPDHDFKEDLLRAICEINVSGSFASFAKLATAPPAGLFVEGLGELTMPLAESQARQLIAKARQAPYGKGSETIVDTSVRNTWELDPQQFTFTDPSWPGYVLSLCDLVAERLGIQKGIKAEIYKMLIYEEGAMFKAHTDTEKIPGMFGTLVICLPSPHEGGEVKVKHCGKEQVLETSKATQSFLCWYSDVSHEVLPVTSGYRWVLTYNLAIDQSQPLPTAALLQSETQPLRDILNGWLAEGPNSREEPWVYHVLDHDYTQANISIRALKAQDLARVRTLKEVCSDLPVEIFLALLEKSEFGSCEYDYNTACRGRYGDWDDDGDSEGESGFHGLDEIFETAYSIKTLVALDGRLVTETLHLEEDHILEEDCFGDDIAEEDYEGYMGNSGPTATHWYRIAAVAIVPHDKISAFFQCGKQYCNLHHSNLAGPIRYFAERCLHRPTDSSINTLMELWQSPTNPSYPYSYHTAQLAIDGLTMESVLKAALQNKRYQFFNTAAAQHRGTLPVTFFSVARVLVQGNKEVFKSIEAGLRTAIVQYSSFADQVKGIQVFAFDKDDQMPGYIVDWARGVLQSCLESIRFDIVGRAEGVAMVDAASISETPSGFLAASIVPRFGDMISNVALSLGFLNRLYQRITKGAEFGENDMSVYQIMVNAFIPATHFYEIDSEMRIKVDSKNVGAPVEPAKLSKAVSHEHLANFFSSLVKMNSGNDIGFIAKLVQSVPQLRHMELHYLWVPFLKALIPILISNSIPFDNANYQLLFRAIFTWYCTDVTNAKPVNNGSLVRPTVNCSCGDCLLLNNFLANPRERVGRFAVNSQRRMHLHRCLDGAGIDCTHETERWGSPQTLVVTKTSRHAEKIQQKWKILWDVAVKQIELFEQDKLKLLLDSDYQMVANMVKTRALPPVQAGARSQATVAGQKRKFPGVEIDLTSD